MSKKIIIAGAGRSGTSFLMQLLTELGFDTGFEKGTKVDSHTRAGLEYLHEFEGDIAGARRLFDSSPRILKAPYLSFSLRMFLSKEIFEVEKLIMPIRDIDEATSSRIEAGLYWGGVGEDFDSQKNEGLRAIGSAVEISAKYSIPVFMMKFPDIVQHEEYCYQMMLKVFDKELPGEKEFGKAFKGLARPDMIRHVVGMDIHKDSDYIKFS